MKIAQRYLAAQFIPPFLLGTGFFVSFLLIFQMFRLVSLVINKSVPWTTTLEMVFHTAVSFLPMALPLSCLFAAIYALGKMSEDSEIVVMRSFGMKKIELLAPFLLIGILIGACLYSLNAELIPYSRSTFRNTIIRLTSQGVLTDIRSEVFFTEIPKVTLFAQKVSDDGNKMEEVFIHLREQEGVEERVIHAKRGALIKQSLGEWQAPNIRMFLEEGNIIKIKQGEVEKVLFEEYDFPVMSGGLSSDFVTKDSMMTNKELWSEIQDNKKRVNQLNGIIKNGGETERLNAAAELATSSKEHYRVELEFWSRLNNPIQCLLFIFMGFSMGIKKGRGAQNRLSAIMSLLALLGYYVLFFGGISFVKKGQLMPELAVFLPSFFILVIAAIYYRKLDWNS